MASTVAFRIQADAFTTVSAVMKNATASSEELRQGWASLVAASPQLATAMQRAEAVATKVVAANRQATASNDNVKTSTTNMGQAVQAAGFQIQDFVVQVSSGTDVMVALAQQGSQLLGMFGRFGAVAGAGLAIAAVAINMVTGKSAAQQLSDALKEQQELFEATLNQAQRYEAALRAQGDQYLRADEAGRRYRDGLRGEGESLARLVDYYARLSTGEAALETARIRRSQTQMSTGAGTLVGEVTAPLGGRLAVAEGRGADLTGEGGVLSGIGGAATLAPDVQKAVEALQHFRAEGQITAQALGTLIGVVHEAAQMNGTNTQELARYEQALIALAPRIKEFEEQQRALNLQLRAQGGDSPSVALARARGVATDVGGRYQDRARLTQQRSDLRAAAPETPEDAARFASSSQAIAAAMEGLRPATSQMLLGLQRQADLSRTASGAARELASADQALSEAARQEGAGQASAAERTEARRLVQNRLNNELTNYRVQLSDRINGIATEAEALGQSARAASDARIATQAEAEAKKHAQVGTEEYNRAVQALTASLGAQRDADEQLANARAISTQRLALAQQAAERTSLSMVPGDRSRFLAELAERQKMEAAGQDTSTTQALQRIRQAGDLAFGDEQMRRLKNFQDGIGRVGDAFSEAFSSAIFDGKKVGDVLNSLSQQIAKIIFQITIGDPLKQALQSGASSIAPRGLGGLFSDYRADTGTFYGSGPDASDASAGGFLGFANGGIMSSRGSLPLHRYASGGIANGPQLALFGEGRMNEAYVPLPDGKSIPVSMKGGGGGGGANYYSIDARGADAGVEQRIVAVLARHVPGIIAASRADLTARMDRGGDLTRKFGRR